MKRVFLFCLGLYLLLSAAYLAVKPITMVLLMLQVTATGDDKAILGVDIASTLFFLALGIVAIRAAMAMRQTESCQEQKSSSQVSSED
jgi:hypothetical protein